MCSFERRSSESNTLTQPCDAPKGQPQPCGRQAEGILHCSSHLLGAARTIFGGLSPTCQDHCTGLSFSDGPYPQVAIHFQGEDLAKTWETEHYKSIPGNYWKIRIYKWHFRELSWVCQMSTTVKVLHSLTCYKIDQQSQLWQRHIMQWNAWYYLLTV